MPAVSAALIAGAMWGLSFVFPAYLNSVPPIWLATARFLFFGIASIVILLVQGKKILVTRQFVLLGLTGYSLYYIILVYGIHQLGVTIPTLIIGLLPLTTFLLGHETQFHRMEIRKSFVWLALVILGVVFANLDSFVIKSFSVLGLLASCACLMLWTYYSVLNSKKIKIHSNFSAEEWTSYTGIGAAVASLLIFGASWTISPDVFIQDFKSFILPQLKPFLIITAILGIGCGWIAIWLWNVASKSLPAQLTGQLIVSETIFGLLYGFILDQRLPRILELLAIVMCIAGVIMLLRQFYHLNKKSSRAIRGVHQ